MGRKRHQKKDIEKVLKEAEDHGWIVVEKPGYWKILCPCARKHYRWVKSTPSDPDFSVNLKHWLKRQDCWT